MYQYNESGLSKVFLQDGYTVHEIDGEEAISIHNLAGLHKVIAQDIIEKSPALTGEEVRYLFRLFMPSSIILDIATTKNDELDFLSCYLCMVQAFLPVCEYDS